MFRNLPLRRATMALAVAALPALAPGLPANGSALTFTPVTLATGTTTAEPGLIVDRGVTPNVVYVNAPDTSAEFWRSANGGASFGGAVHTGQGGGDADAAVDADGTVYVADLCDTAGTCNMPVTTYTSRGTVRAHSAIAAPAGGYDRPWVAARGHGYVVAVADTGAETDAYVSTDTGTTFSGPFVVDTNNSLNGAIKLAPDGSFWLSYFGSNGTINAAHSTDGKTWSVFTAANIIAADHGSGSWPDVAIDAGGTVYVVWQEGLLLSSPQVTSSVKLAASTDGGSTWSAPIVIDSATGVFPRVAAGHAGSVDIAFYAARTLAGLPSTGPDVELPTTTWDVDVVQVTGLPGGPVLNATVAASGVHTGSICTLGTLCNPLSGPGGLGIPQPALDRRLLDFIGLDVDGAGNALLTYPVDSPIGIFGSETIKVSRQTGGPTV